MQDYLEKTKKELKYRNYSTKSIDAYLGCLEEYLKYIQSNFKFINKEKVKDFLIAK